MAFSQPLSSSVRQKGQTAIQCQLCENDPKVKWKCLDCKLMMCNRCRDKVHPKFPSADAHTIIDIKDISKHQIDPELILDFTKFKCDAHAGKNCCMFCNTCNELVCLTCIAKTHNTHNFGEINDEYQTKLETVKIREDELKGKVRSLKTREQKLQQIKSNEQSNYDKVKQEILDNEKALVNEIKKHTNKLLKELDQKWEAFTNSVGDETRQLKEIQSQLQKQIQEINQSLQPDNAKDLFSDSLLKSTEIIKIPALNTSIQGVPKFTGGDRTKIPLILGKFKDVTIQYTTELKVDKKFDTDLKCIDTVVSCPDDSLWIANMVSGIFQKVKLNGDNLSVMSNLKLKVYDAALLPSGDLLLSAYGLSNLKLVPSGSTDIQDSVFTVSPLVSTAIHVTCDNKVIIGAFGGTSAFPANGPRQVIVMDQTGHQEKVFQYDRHNKPLFTYSFHITSNSQGNIAVVDWVSKDWRGRVIVLDQEGEVRNIFTGHPDVNNEDKPFKPRGITTTPSDNFVLADVKNNTLHILNSEGEIITFYNTEEMGILRPKSLSFSTTGQLYIGCDTYKRSKENAKLFRVNNFLC